MRGARRVEPSISPLDEELELMPGSWTPLMHESQVRLGTWMPFGRAAKEFEFHHGAKVDAETVRRNTQRAGSCYMPEQERVPDRPVQSVPDRQALSVDGAFVHLNTRVWREVKTLTASRVAEKGECHEVSYFSRSTSSDEFKEQVRGELTRRGVKQSAEVCAVADGADWIQGLIDTHRPDAVRILDFYHAAERLAKISHAIFDPDQAAFESWFARQRHELRHGDPDVVLHEIYELTHSHPQHAEMLNEHLNYLATRRAQIGYHLFEQQGWPVGSGSGEAAHTVVVHSRMKLAGMRWAERNVDSMLALRNLACNDRWAEGWALIAARARQSPPPDPVPEQPKKLLPPGVAIVPLPGWRFDHRISTKS